MPKNVEGDNLTLGRTYRTLGEPISVTQSIKEWEKYIDALKQSPLIPYDGRRGAQVTSRGRKSKPDLEPSQQPNTQ